LPQHQFDIYAVRGRKDFGYNFDEYDLIHINYSYGLTREKDIIKKYGHKIILTLSNQRTLLKGEGGDSDEFIEMMNSVAEITSVSPIMAHDRIKYIPNGIDEDLFFKSKKLIVGYAGSKNPGKNFNLIKEVCEELGLELRCEADIAKMDNQVVSVIPHNQMQDFYMGIDVYVHPSKTEGCNNTILEALSCNVPVLMTRQGIYQDLEDYVIFIEPTKESIKQELKKFLGRQLIEKKFLWKNIVKEYDKIYASFANRS
jgi:glycosyltransferase involved in cell wall biosynthesis